MSALRWTSKGIRKLAAELRAMGHEVSYFLVSALLREAVESRAAEPCAR